MHPILTVERARQLFTYDAEAGHLRYRIRTSPRISIGDTVGGDAERYRYIRVDGTSTPVHHLVWFWHHGSWPEADLSFKNGKPWDTHIENLVPQSKVETATKHPGLRATNKTGIKGVSPTKDGKFQAHIYGPGGSRALGRHFKTIEEASAAIERAKAEGTSLRSKTAEQRARLRSKTAEQRARKDLTWQSRKTWRKLTYVAGGKHDWEDPSALFAEVGFPPSRSHVLAPIDAMRSIGPGNTQWVLPVVGIAPVAAKDPDYYLDRKLRQKYGITLGEYREKLEEQNGVCAICGNPETHVRKSTVRMLSVDHDHLNGKVRGLLCRDCNVGIGSLKDTPEVLRKAAGYIEKWRKVHTEPLPDNVVSLRKDH